MTQREAAAAAVATRRLARAAAAEATGWKTARRCLVASAALCGFVVMIPLFALGGGPTVPASADAIGLDPVVLDAYLRAEATPDATGCALRWTILAAVGKVESGNAGGRVVSDAGDVTPHIVGIPLDGTRGTAAIADTDGGTLDGDTAWDRAVGPMQFIPSSWSSFGRDGNGDGRLDPQNIYDAAAAAAAHLCLASPGDFAVEEDLAGALHRYNNSDAYVAAVLGWVAHYDELAATGQQVSLVVGERALPLDRAWFVDHPEWFTSTHHDYPAADLAVPVGTPLYAVTDGRVRATTVAATRCGLGVVLAGSDGWDYVYCHASSVAVGAGQRVRAGDLVGWSGNTGRSFGPHLHFGVQSPGGRRVCPQPLLAAWFRGEAADPATVDDTNCVGGSL